MTGTRLSRQLLAWYDQNRRQLPWRDDPSPYHVWLSEIMLQQTRVSAVREYYTRFLSALPTIESLAKADEDLYLKLWEGLGYYSRVRNLHKAAVEIMMDYEGQMPGTSKELQKLSGIWCRFLCPAGGREAVRRDHQGRAAFGRRGIAGHLRLVCAPHRRQL